MARPALQKLGVKHEDILNYVLANPNVTQQDVADKYGLTRVWVNIVMNSDAFQAALAERQNHISTLVDINLAEQIRGVANFAVEDLGRCLEAASESGIVPQRAEFLLDATDKLLHRAGYAPTRGPTVQVNHNTQNNYLPVEQSVLAECRQDMLGRANVVKELNAPDDNEVLEAVLVALPTPGTV